MCILSYFGTYYVTKCLIHVPLNRFQQIDLSITHFSICWVELRGRVWNIQAPCRSKMRREPKLAETIHLSIQKIVVLGFCGDLAMQKQLKATWHHSLLATVIPAVWLHRYPAVASGSWAATSMNGNSINPLPTSMLMANMQDQILGLPKVEGMRFPLVRLRYIYIHIYNIVYIYIHIYDVSQARNKSSTKGRFLWI